MANDFVSEQNIDDFLEIKEESSPIITENDIKLWSRCSYAYFLKRHKGLSKIPQTGTALESMIFQQARKALMRIRSETGRLFYKDTRVGPQSKTLNELTKDELPNYLAFSSPESFGNAIFGRWMIMDDRFANRDIVWNFNGQKYSIGKELKTACTNYYKFILGHGTPLPGYINKDTAVNLNGTKIRITFPEIRKGMIIDDPTIWSFNAEHQFDLVPNLEDSALVTLRIMAFTQLVSEYPGYARVWGMSDKEAEEISNNIISPKIKYRHFNASKSLLNETSRTEKDLSVLNMIVDKFLEDTAKNKFVPNHKHCQGCGYNVIDARGEIVCDKARKGLRTHVPERYFKKKNLSIDTINVSDTETEIVIQIGEAEGRHPILLGKYSINIPPQENAVRSIYLGNIRGIGIEEIAIKEADKYLQKLSNEKNTSITHKIEFNRDFKYAGQKNIAELINRLGYIDTEKTYAPKMPITSAKKVDKNK
ncbi:MAG: hypothetical protein ACP5NW_04415 [Candidatus Woesearchaeota archaeon]